MVKLSVVSAVTVFLAVVAQAQEVERVLAPIVVARAGAFGSYWTYELFVHNGNDHPVHIGGLPTTDDFVGPKESTRLFMSPREGTPGQFLSIRASDLEKMAWQLHVRDISRNARAWGTGIPVVPVREFRTAFTLLNVPLTEDHRETLRVYTDGQATTIRITIGRLEDSGVAQDLVVDDFFVPSTSASGIPGYFELANFKTRYTELRGVERIRISLSAMSPIWAFASVANNETQEVTLFSPN